MNYWQIQAVARRKNRAHNDILGLLENSHQRKRKIKKTQSVIRKHFGIFAKSLTFNVRLNENNEYEPVKNDTPTSNERIVVQNPIGRNKKNTMQKRNKGKKNDGAPVAKSRLQGFDVADLIDDNLATSETDQHKAAKQMANSNTVNVQRQKVPSKRTPHPKPVLNKAAVPINRNTQNYQNKNVLQECDFVDYPVDFRHESVDFTIGTLDVTAQKSDRTRPLDLLNEYNLPNDPQTSIGSVDFNAVDNHIAADNYKPSADFDNFKSNFGNQSTSKSLCKSVSDASKLSGWSLETPYFSEGLNSSTVTTATSFQVNKQTKPSIDAVLARISEDDLIGISPFSQPSHHELCFDTNANRDIYNSQQSVSSDGLSSFNLSIESTDKNATFNDFDEPIKTKPFTLSMVIGRKSLGAHRAYERIFGSRTERPAESTSNVNRILQPQINGANRPQMPAKPYMPTTTSFFKNTFTKPIKII